MVGETDGGGGRTRRQYLTCSGALAVGGAVAGCSDLVGQGGTTATPGCGSYTVSMSPLGEVTFESPPETVFTRLTHHADVAFALGRGDTINAMHVPDYYDGLWNQFFERLPGVSLDWTGQYSSWESDEGTLYGLNRIFISQTRRGSPNRTPGTAPASSGSGATSHRGSATPSPTGTPSRPPGVAGRCRQFRQVASRRRGHRLRGEQPGNDGRRGGDRQLQVAL
jgi:hypothetical protein